MSFLRTIAGAASPIPLPLTLEGGQLCTENSDSGARGFQRRYIYIYRERERDVCKCVYLSLSLSIYIYINI